MKRKRYVDVSTIIEPSYYKQYVPEHKLWWSVLKRAIVDYINFFDYASHNLMSKDIGRRMRKNMQRQMREELWALNWFFYEREILPYNLTWIADMCFQDIDILHNVRRELLQIHIGHMKEYMDCPEMKFLLEDYFDMEGR
jgi:hypothetical protein